VSSSYNCYEASESHISGLISGSASTVPHSDVSQNQFESYTNNHYAAYTGFFNSPSSSLWTKETSLETYFIDMPEGSLATIFTTTSSTSYCEAMEGFDIADNYISITYDGLLYNSSGLPIEVETDFYDTSIDDGSSGGGGGGDDDDDDDDGWIDLPDGRGALNIVERVSISYQFMYTLAYAWRVDSSTKYDYYDEDYHDTISLSAEMDIYDGDYTTKSEMMPAQAISDPDGFEQINSDTFEYLTTDGTVYEMNIPLHPTGKPEYFIDKFDLEIYRFTKTDVLFEDWWIDGEFLKMILPAEALLADSYMFIFKMSLKEGVTLPSDMDSSLKSLTLTVEVQPDVLTEYLFFINF